MTSRPTPSPRWSTGCSLRPRYGEQWGRHWLDVARYADSTGMDEDNLYPHAWRYRDYVVEAFNEDTPFNDFVKQQLAGDLLPAQDAAERARNVVRPGSSPSVPSRLRSRIGVQMIYDVVDEQIDTTTKAFLGLTVACARCHDHKFDPIPTKDYYGLASIFASTTGFPQSGPARVDLLHALHAARSGRIRSLPGAPLANTSQAVGDGARACRRKRSVKPPSCARSSRISSSPRGTCSSKALPSDCGGTTATSSCASESLDQMACGMGRESPSTYLEQWHSATAEAIATVAKPYEDDYVKSGAKWDSRGWRNGEHVLRKTPCRTGSVLIARHSTQRKIHSLRRRRLKADRWYSRNTEGGRCFAPNGSNCRYDAGTTGARERGCGRAVIEQPVFMRGSLHSPGELVAKHFPDHARRR